MAVTFPTDKRIPDMSYSEMDAATAWCQGQLSAYLKAYGITHEEAMSSPEGQHGEAKAHQYSITEITRHRK